MTILNNEINESAKAFNGESRVTPSHMGFTETSLTIDVADTSLTGEIGSRITLTGSRSLNTVELVGLRLSTDVVDTSNGDDLKGQATFSASTSGTMLIEDNIAGLLHTKNFDVEFITGVNYIQG